MLHKFFLSNNLLDIPLNANKKRTSNCYLDKFCMQYSVFGSIVTFGAMIGAITIGPISDFLGRKGVRWQNYVEYTGHTGY